ncbi:MAG TPA: dihydrolipoamide acetyltransferase family protein [Methanocellaceae archaeon]
MTFEFKLPDLGEGITSGEIKRWAVKKGERVEEDQPIAEIETDKAVVELPSPVTGTLEELRFPEGTKVNVGDVVAVIKEEGGTPEQKPVQEKATEKVMEARNPEASPPPAAEKKIPALATPATRMLAKQANVDINAIKGTGPGGRITDEDVKKAAGQPAAKPEAAQKPEAAPKPGGTEERIPIRGIRRAISEHMMQSLANTAPVTLMDDADMSKLIELRKSINDRLAGISKASLLAFMVKAVVASLRTHPMLNVSIDESKNEIIKKRYYHIGIAVDTDNGLIVPVVKDADKKSIIELSKEINDLAEIAREGKLNLDQMKGGTFTIANVGSIGGLFSTPIMNYPELAVLEMQQMRDMPRAVNGQVVVRKVMNLSLTIDHRVIDGAEGQRFMNDLKKYLEEPDLLFAGMV